MKEKIDNNRLPFITIVMPVRNESAFIERSLNSVLAQDYPADRLEVIVSDGLSDDDTRSIINLIKKEKSTIPIKIIDNTGLIVPTGLNAAIRIARGDIIIRVDGHTIISKNYVSECVLNLVRTDAANIGGKMDAVGINSFGKAVALATSCMFGIGGSRFHFSDKEESADTVYMGAWPKVIFHKYGMFDEEQVRNQDDEFNYRLRKNGERILLCPSIKSKYYTRSTLKKLWTQYYQYGYWKVRVLQKHSRQMSLRQFIPPSFVFCLSLSIILALFSAFGKGLLLLVAGSYILANITASILTAKKQGWQHLLRLPIVFIILHIAYGSGFLVGLVKFANRWNQTGIDTKPLKDNS